MAKGQYNIGERRGMLVVIGLLAAISIITFGIRNCNTSTPSQAESIDSIAHQLHSQVDSLAAPAKSNTKKKRKSKKDKKHNTPKKIPKERNPLDESLPQNN
ncbi:MAG: hypothetical protein IKV83_03185 [Muribaculaceae bacterium]|nr:hypothetical protein [Muribaculaceae bacterium]